jgi:hypothetical protein
MVKEEGASKYLVLNSDLSPVDGSMQMSKIRSQVGLIQYCAVYVRSTQHPERA